MNCEEFRDIVFELASGELDEAVSKAAEAHMADCSRCRKEYEAVADLVRALREAGEVRAPEDLLPNVMKAVRNERAVRRFSLIKYAATAAAAVVLVAGAVKVLPGIVKDPDNPPVSEVVQGTESVGDREPEVENRSRSISPDGGAILDTVETTADDTSAEPADSSNVISDDSVAGESKAVQLTSDKVNEKAGNTGTSKMSQQVSPRNTTDPSEQPRHLYDEGDSQTDKDSEVINSPGGGERGNGTAVISAPKIDISDDQPMPVANGEDDFPILEEDGTAQDVPDEDAESSASVYARGSSGGGSGGSSSYGVTDTDETVGIRITTADLDSDETVAQEDERTFIHKTCRFTVSAEFSDAVKDVETKGRTMVEVADALDALGVEYDICVVEDDYTEEYRTADPERRAEIEAMCAAEVCEIEIER